MTKRKSIFAALLLISASSVSGCGHYDNVGPSRYILLKDQSVASVMEETSDKEQETLTEISNKDAYEIDGDEKRSSPDSFIIDDVPHIFQGNAYPTGCESVSAVSLMNYYGIDITVDEFIDNYLSCSSLPEYDSEGDMYAESPWYSFIGDPRSANGYGCYASVIESAINQVLPDGYIAESEYGIPLEYIAEEYIANGEPVIIWATVNMKSSFYGNSWVVPNGEYFTFVCPEHALILVGYDEESYYFCDPMAEEDIVSYCKDDCEQAYSALYSQMIKIRQI